VNTPATFGTSRLLLRAPVVDDRRWLVAPNLGPVPRDVWSFARIKEMGARA